VLRLTGDNHGNSIDVTNNGDGHVTVVATGLPELNFPDVTIIDVAAGNGSNQVHYFQEGDDLNPSGNQLREFGLRVDLGKGESEFQADFSAHAVLAGMGLTVLGSGNDTINFNAQGVDIGAQAALNIFAIPEGTEAKVTASVAYSGVKEGSLAVFLGEAKGETSLHRLRLSLDATFAPGSTPADGDEFRFLGGRGDDSLEMFLHDEAGLGPSGVIDGGSGFNTATHTDNVIAVNCQRQIEFGFGGELVRVGPLGGGLGHMLF
jgi:hypothetical protein